MSQGNPGEAGVLQEIISLRLSTTLREDRLQTLGEGGGSRARAVSLK